MRWTQSRSAHAESAIPRFTSVGTTCALGRCMTELKDRVEARKHELLSKLNELKADTRAEAENVRKKTKAKLDQIESDLEGGWDRMSESVRTKLNAWLDRD